MNKNKLDTLYQNIYDAVKEITTEVTSIVKNNGGFVLTQGYDVISAIYDDGSREEREGIIEALKVETYTEPDGNETDRLFAFIRPYGINSILYDEVYIRKEFEKEDSGYVYSLDFSSEVYMVPTMTQIAWLLDEYLDVETS